MEKILNMRYIKNEGTQLKFSSSSSREKGQLRTDFGNKIENEYKKQKKKLFYRVLKSFRIEKLINGVYIKNI